MSLPSVTGKPVLDRGGGRAYHEYMNIYSYKAILSATEIFSALADSTRFRILLALLEGELCVSDLVCATSVSQSAVSHQLRFLRDRRLVKVRRDGQRMLYSLADDHVRSLIELALDHVAEEGEL
jgi:ArsR family transcriptional regulator